MRSLFLVVLSVLLPGLRAWADCPAVTQEIMDTENSYYLRARCAHPETGAKTEIRQITRVCLTRQDHLLFFRQMTSKESLVGTCSTNIIEFFHYSNDDKQLQTLEY